MILLLYTLLVVFSMQVMGDVEFQLTGFTSAAINSVGMTTLTVPYPYQSLSYNLYTNVEWILARTNTGYYQQPLLISTNNQLWTWPLNLSCVGLDTYGGYSHCLVSSNSVIVNYHYGQEVGELIEFADTNGFVQTSYVSNLVYIANSDLVIAQMSNSYPASVVPAYVFPENWTNYLVQHSPSNLPAIFVHQNTRTIESVLINFWAPVGPGAPYDLTIGWQAGLLCVPPLLHGGPSVTGGDSGSPTFMIYNLNGTPVPVLLFCMTGGSAGGACISHPDVWSIVTNNCPGIKIIDLSGFNIQ